VVKSYKSILHLLIEKIDISFEDFSSPMDIKQQGLEKEVFQRNYRKGNSALSKRIIFGAALYLQRTQEECFGVNRAAGVMIITRGAIVA
jgi:hypothetical protein